MPAKTPKNVLETIDDVELIRSIRETGQMDIIPASVKQKLYNQFIVANRLKKQTSSLDVSSSVMDFSPPPSLSPSNEPVDVESMKKYLASLEKTNSELLEMAKSHRLESDGVFAILIKMAWKWRIETNINPIHVIGAIFLGFYVFIFLDFIFKMCETLRISQINLLD